MKPVLVFDIETIPDVAGLRRLGDLPGELSDAEVAELAFQQRRVGGAPGRRGEALGQPGAAVEDAQHRRVGRRASRPAGSLLGPRPARFSPSVRSSSGASLGSPYLLLFSVQENRGRPSAV